jgi:cell division protein FtsW
MGRIRVDLPLLLAVLTLMSIGIVIVYSSSWPLGATKYDDAAFFAKRQAFAGVIALCGMLVGAAVAPRRWLGVLLPMLAGSAILLVIVLIPGIGTAAGIARRWIEIGPIRLQAGEPLKFVLVVYLAASLAKKGEAMKRFSVGVLPHVIVPGLAIFLLMLEPDFGTAAMLAAVTLIMLFVGGARVGYLAGAVIALIPVGAVLIASSPYRMRRILAFLDPWAHRYDIGYQITESLMTLGSGGATGLGLGAGKQKLFFLPAAHTDFAFAVVGEELGFVGVLVVLTAFAVILWRGARAAMKHTDAFRAFLALGITTLLVLQAVLNVAVVLGVVPTKGLTLPFISYGGSSLMISGFLAGVLLRLCGEVPQGRFGVEKLGGRR